MLQGRDAVQNPTACLGGWHEEDPPRMRTRANPKGKAPLTATTSQPVAGTIRIDSKFFGTDSEDSLSGSEIEGNRRKEFLKDKKTDKEKSKPTKRKRAAWEPTIAERMHSVQEHLEEIEFSIVAQLTASAKDWLKDMELIRSKTAASMQGTLSGRIRERIGALHKVLDTLAVRLEEKGDLAYQKRRNAELQAELLASQRETKRLHRRVDELQKTVEDLRIRFVTDGGVSQANKATSLMEAAGRVGEKGSQVSLEEPSANEAVMRPSLKGVSAPIPSGGCNVIKEEVLSRQIAKLVEKRKLLRRGNVARDDPHDEVARTLPRIISDVQVRPPGGGVMDEEADVWQVAGKPVKKKKKIINNNNTNRTTISKTTKVGLNGDHSPQQSKAAPSGQQSNRKKGTNTPSKRRVSRTAAVAIQGIEEGFSYASALKSL